MPKARIYAYCNRRIGKRDEPDQVCIDVDLPFVPQVGMAMLVTEACEIADVETVLMDLTQGDAGPVLQVWLAMTEGLPQWPAMKAEGWRIYSGKAKK